MGIAGDGVDVPTTAVAVAATYVSGSAPHSGNARSIPIGPWPRRHTDFAEARARSGAGRGIRVAHAGRRAPTRSSPTSRATASPHHDAHLVKYTLACFDAAAIDPSLSPPLPRCRRVALRLVGPTSRARIRLLTEARVPRVGARGRGASGDGPRSRRRSPAGSPTPGHRRRVMHDEVGHAERGETRGEVGECIARSHRRLRSSIHQVDVIDLGGVATDRRARPREFVGLRPQGALDVGRGRVGIGRPVGDPPSPVRATVRNVLVPPAAIANGTRGCCTQPGIMRASCTV